MSIERAFESLLSQNCFTFILTMGCTGVSIYHTYNGIYKIFDSHARGEYGTEKPSPRYVCTIRSTIHSELNTVCLGYTLTC